MIGPSESVITATKGAATGGLAALAIDEVFRHYSGVSLVALVASAGGAVAAFAYYSEPNRHKLFALAAANTFFGVALMVLLPLWFGLPPVPRAAEPAVSFILGAACRWLIPLVIEVAPAWIRRLLRVPAEKPNNPDGE